MVAIEWQQPKAIVPGAKIGEVGTVFFLERRTDFLLEMGTEFVLQSRTDYFGKGQPCFSI